MNIVITNDDGYEAAGLLAAYNAVRSFGDVVLVAPKTERSACSHSITMRRPITVEKRHHPKYGTSFAVDGTPADCVRLAFSALVERPIDLVVSGINHGANAGVDMFYSGTIAGAREAAVLGLPAVALSQSLRAGLEPDWNAAAEISRVVMQQILKDSLPEAGFWSVNFPAPIPPDAEKHIQRVPTASHPMPMDFQRNDSDDGRVMEFGYGASYWLREVSGPSDYSVIRDGGIAVTAIPLFGKF